MLKKLFVHEWRDCWKLMALVNGLVMVISLMGIVMFRDDFWNTADENTFAGVSMMLYMMLYFTSIGALSFVVSIYFYIRFFRNLYTDQGYLMHTLPVTPENLIWSKAFVGVIWQFISAIVITLSVFILVGSVIGNVDGVSLSELWKELVAEIELEPMAIVVILEIGVLMVLSSFMSIFFGYTAISIGQLCKKQKVLGAIGAYVLIYIVFQIVSSFAMIPLTNFMESVTVNEDMVGVVVFLLVVMIAVALVTVGLYFANLYIMKNKLNLE